MNFVEINIGKWMTQRTTYTTKQGLIHVNQSEIIIQKNNEADMIGNIQCKDESNLKTKYDVQDNIDKEVISLIYDIEQNSFNKIKNKNMYLLSYHINKDNHISISTRLGNLHSIEKLWLVNPNLRLGVNIIKKYNKCIAITFSSDIRIM